MRPYKTPYLTTNVPLNREYPTSKELIKIESWDFSKNRLDDFLSFLESIWHWPDWGFDLKRSKLQLHTGGWSGNESIMAALEKNYIFWTLCWYQTTTGGHYKFKLRTLRKISKKRPLDRRPR